MRKSTKRKASHEEEATKSTEETNKEPSKAVERAKRLKTSKRNLEDLWQCAFPVGTEWDLLDQVYQYKWNFSNLENAFEEGGELYRKKVYLFGSTEHKIGIKSVQRVNEEIVPMKQMKMDWVPYIPLEDRDSQVERLQCQIFTLSCTQRRHNISCQDFLPSADFYDPFKEDELEQKTIVPILYPKKSEPVISDSDWEFDESEEFADTLIKDQKLSEDEKDAFKEYVKQEVLEAKKDNREARETRRKAVQEMSEETKAAFQNMRFYKFYPVPTADSSDVPKSLSL